MDCRVDWLPLPLQSQHLCSSKYLSRHRHWQDIPSLQVPSRKTVSAGHCSSASVWLLAVARMTSTQQSHIVRQLDSGVGASDAPERDPAQSKTQQRMPLNPRTQQRAALGLHGHLAAERC